MCIICVQYEVGKLTRGEAWNAAKEIVVTAELDEDTEHLRGLLRRLATDELYEKEPVQFGQCD